VMDIQKNRPMYFSGTNKNIQIHHIHPFRKISHKIWSWSRERIEQELKMRLNMHGLQYRLSCAI